MPREVEAPTFSPRIRRFLLIIFSNNLIFKVMTSLKNMHPGEILLEEFLIPFKVSAYRLSKDIGIPQTRISEIIKGRRRVTADSALRFSKYFGTSPKFWLGLQDDYDLEEEKMAKGLEIESIQQLNTNAA